jgi:hypothetical protein
MTHAQSAPLLEQASCSIGKAPAQDPRNSGSRPRPFQRRRQIRPTFLIDGLLTLDAIRRPGYRGEALGPNRSVTTQASSISSIAEAIQRLPHLPKKARFPIKMEDGGVTLSGKDHVVNRIRGPLDRNALPLAQFVSQINFSFLQQLPVLLSFISGH